MRYPPPSPDSRTSGQGSDITRRRLLAGGSRAMLALAVLGPAAAACGSGKPSGPDPLEAQLAAARSDSAMARAAAAAAPPALSPALAVVAGEREQHAAALVEELARAAGEPTPDPTATAAVNTTAASEPAAPPPTVRQVAEALRQSADSAAALVPTLSGYRAGLLGSIAAACTALHTVGLLPRERKNR